MKMLTNLSLALLLVSSSLGAQSLPPGRDIHSILDAAPESILKVDAAHHQVRASRWFNRMRLDLVGRSSNVEVSRSAMKATLGSATLTLDLETGLIVFNRVQAQRGQFDFTAPLSDERGLEVAKDFLIHSLKLNEQEFVLDGQSKHMMRRANGVETVEDLCFDFRRTIHGLKCYGPGTTATIQVGRELTVNHARIDWPVLSQPHAAVRIAKDKVLEQAPKATQATLARSTEGPAAILVYRTQKTKDGSIEFVPALGVRGEARETWIPGQPRYHPVFIPVVETLEK